MASRMLAKVPLSRVAISARRLIPLVTSPPIAPVKSLGAEGIPTTVAVSSEAVTRAPRNSATIFTSPLMNTTLSLAMFISQLLITSALPSWPPIASTASRWILARFRYSVAAASSQYARLGSAGVSTKPTMAETACPVAPRRALRATAHAFDVFFGVISPSSVVALARTEGSISPALHHLCWITQSISGYDARKAGTKRLSRTMIAVSTWKPAPHANTITLIGSGVTNATGNAISPIIIR